jgi:hypothetical protein
LQNTRFGIGAVILIAPAESLGEQMSYFSGSPYTGAPNTSREFLGFQDKDDGQGPRDAWRPPQGWGTGSMASAIAASKPNLPIGIANCGQNGATIGGWIAGGFLSFLSEGDIARSIIARTGGFEIAVMNIGVNDVQQGTSPADFSNRAQVAFANLRAISGRPNLNIQIIGTGSAGPGHDPTAIQNAQKSLIDNNTIWWGGSNAGLPLLSDGIHITWDANGQGAVGTAVGQSIARFL